MNDDNPDKWFASFIQNIEKLTGDCISAKNLIKNGTNVPLEFIVLINAKINVLKGASEKCVFFSSFKYN